MNRIKYICKNCGWTTHIRAEWGDIRPKRCPVRKCNTNFLAFPEKLEIHRPGEKPKTQAPNIRVKREQPEVDQKVEDKEKSEHGKSSRKKKGSSKAVKQQADQGES